MDSFWSKFLNNPDSIIIDGEHYIVGKEDDRPNMIKGFGGRDFVIEKFDGTIIKTTNLWHQGEIPDDLKDQFKENAKFLNVWGKPYSLWEKLNEQEFDSELS